MLFSKRSRSVESFAVVTKLNTAELPYLKSFVDYYHSLGVEHFYFVDATPGEPGTVHRALHEWYGPTAGFFTVEPDKWTGDFRAIYNQFYGRIGQDWTIVVDIDEYVYLGSASTLSDFVGNRTADHFFFPWLMCPADDWIIPAGPVTGFLGGASKYMARTNRTRWMQHHTFWRKPGVLDLTKRRSRKVRYDGEASDGAMCVHYWGRGLSDVILKSIWQTKGGKVDAQRSLEQISEPSELPKRLKLLALLCRKDRPIKLSTDCHVHVDSEWLDRLLSTWTTGDVTAHITELYQQYKEDLSQELVDSYPGEKTLANMASTIL